MGALLFPALLVGGAVAAGSMMGGSGSVSLPSVKAESGKTVTAKPLEQLSEKEKTNRRLAASTLTQNWGGLKLGTKGLLGL
jgi:hypothetical protein